jgi:hypothetical protein
MLDADIVAVSPTSVWRVLSQAGLLSKWNGKPSKKGTGFEQPLAAHQHWHIVAVVYFPYCLAALPIEDAAAEGISGNFSGNRLSLAIHGRLVVNQQGVGSTSVWRAKCLRNEFCVLLVDRRRRFGLNGQYCGKAVSLRYGNLARRPAKTRFFTYSFRLSRCLRRACASA